MSAKGARFNGFFRFSKSDLQDVFLFDLRATSHISFYDTSLNQLQAVSVKTDTFLNLIRSQFAGPVRLSAGHAAKGLSTSGSRFNAGLTATRFTSLSNLFMSSTEIVGDLFFNSARISGSAEFHKMTVSGTLDLRAAHISELLYLNDGQFQKVDLNSATIKHLVAYGTSFNGDLVLDYSVLTSANLADADQPGLHLPKWGNTSEIHVFEADIGLLLAHVPLSFTRVDHSIVPMNLANSHIRGFSFVADKSPQQGQATGPSDVTNWIAGAMNANGGTSRHFSTKPYEDLENWYTSAGDYEAARAVKYAKMLELTRSLPDTASGWLQRILWYWPLKVFVGFGAYPWWAVMWFFGWVALGAAVGKRWGTAPKSLWFWVRYSSDNAIPLLETSVETRDFAHTSGKVWGFFLIHKLIGFVLVSILIGSITFT